MAKFGRVVVKICERTDRQTDRHTDSLQYRERNKTKFGMWHWNSLPLLVFVFSESANASGVLCMLNVLLQNWPVFFGRLDDSLNSLRANDSRRNAVHVCSAGNDCLVGWSKLIVTYDDWVAHDEHNKRTEPYSAYSFADCFMAARGRSLVVFTNFSFFVAFIVRTAAIQRRHIYKSFT